LATEHVFRWRLGQETLSVLAKHANESISQSKNPHAQWTDSMLSYERLAEFEENGNGPWAQIGWNFGIPAELNVFGSRELTQF
jgi:hypothetical protein